ncbi:flagellar motor switch protein FliN [Planctomicrobium sp. SH661]|uniref:flagellar motor switch protein FliN n=1 Tax=Planctomicrobium sp. SH661 TaxID=3448124 RepID=UPI003F5BCEB0
MSVGQEEQQTTNVYPVEFPAAGGPQLAGARVPLNRFYDVNMTVSVELGRVTMPIGDLLHLSEGAVIQLDRLVSQPVDIIAQGVRLARGEVVVVEERYAVRITEIEAADSPADLNQKAGRK